MVSHSVAHKGATGLLSHGETETNERQRQRDREEREENKKRWNGTEKWREGVNTYTQHLFLSGRRGGREVRRGGEQGRLLSPVQ